MCRAAVLASVEHQVQQRAVQKPGPSMLLIALSGIAVQSSCGTSSSAADGLTAYPGRRLAQLLVFKKVRSALAVIKCMVSGGGSLAVHLDDFFEGLGLPVVNGWGLSEVCCLL